MSFYDNEGEKKKVTRSEKKLTAIKKERKKEERQNDGEGGGKEEEGTHTMRILMDVFWTSNSIFFESTGTGSSSNFPI